MKDPEKPKNHQVSVEKPEGYKTGYKKPPLHTQFTKGKSGNPKGRPKKMKSIPEILSEELHRPVSVVTNGKKQKVPTIVLIIRQILKGAIQLDKAAMIQALKFVHVVYADLIEKEAKRDPFENSQTFWDEEAEKLYQAAMAIDPEQFAADGKISEQEPPNPDFSYSSDLNDEETSDAE